MIVIIGAGPVGCFLGGLLAKAGRKVAIYEEHDCIGKPVQCTGIVTEEIGKIVKLDKEFLVNKVNKVRVYSKNNKIEIGIRDIVIDREKFDRYLARKAEKNGAKIHLNYKFLGIRGNNAVLADKNNKIINVEAEYIIGADGPLSDVAKSNAMVRKKEFFFGMQARIKGSYDPECYEVYLGSVCKDFFAWVLPESNKIARVGVACRSNTRSIFKEFLDVKGIEDRNIIDFQAGLIPIFNKKACVKRKNVCLVGDAAGHVKATTGGGLVPGLKAAKVLANCIVNGKNYEKGLKKLNKELDIHLKIRNMLDRFNDKDYNKLLKLLKNRKIKHVLHKNSRDSPKKLVFKALIAKPSLLQYIKNFIK
ncbi:geranylgeranyl reductase family protein [Candidatus Woesearchaeota archaeon]|nr:geranylgeranyl reductase family protein [Candidatus Woesearchaeota archaeon]